MLIVNKGLKILMVSALSFALVSPLVANADTVTVEGLSKTHEVEVLLGLNTEDLQTQSASSSINNGIITEDFMENAVINIDEQDVEMEEQGIIVTVTSI